MRREKKDYVVVTFRTTAEAMAMEQYCAAHGIRGRLIPVPGEISAGCGICWRMTAEDYAAAGQSEGCAAQTAGQDARTAEWKPDAAYDRIIKIRM